MYSVESMGGKPQWYSVESEEKKEVSVLEKVERMVNDKLTQALAREHGLSVQTVSWEDTARSKDSCWGPNISDMTLQVKDGEGEYHRMPVIRQPNYSDKTHDAPIDSFSVLTGNEAGQEILTRILLKDYLEGFTNYMPGQGTIKGSLFSSRDTHVIHNVQACFLPAASGEEVNFNVALYNYQSYSQNPAVLAIVISSHGTSAQIIDNGDSWEGQRLTFNKNTMSCDFVASRLKDVRSNEGRVVEGSLSREEKENRKLLIIQIPLKVEEKLRFDDVVLECMSYSPKGFDDQGEECASIDDAQISIGKEEGEFGGLKGLAIERDERYPIRITTQLYKITDDGMINREQMEKIVAEIKEEESIGQQGSSLVLENTLRPTEWKV